MEYISTVCEICSLCNRYECFNISIEYDECAIIPIIDSNFITYIDICSHNINVFEIFLINNKNYKFGHKYFEFGYEQYCVYNYDYLKNVNYINAHCCYDSSELLFFFLHGNFRQIGIKEFMNTIKSGTIINCNNAVSIELKKLLNEYNTNFTLIHKNFNRESNIYIIDAQTLTKPAVKQ